MLIRNHDKSILLNMDNVSSVVIDKRVKGSIKIFEGGADMTGYEIARYATDEKAMKVLDEIERRYALGNPTYSIPADDEVEEQG